MYMSKTAQFDLDYPPQKAIYLFSGEGEKYWVKDWKPVFSRGNGFNKNDVFYVNSFEGKPIFIVLDFDEHQCRASYSEVFPGLTAGTLDIDITPIGDDKSSIQITYNLSALGSEGEKSIEELERNYEKAILAWKEDIEKSKVQIQSWFDTF